MQKRRKELVEEVDHRKSFSLEQSRSRIFEKFHVLSSSPSSEREINIETPPLTPVRSPSPEESKDSPREHAVKQREIKPLKSVEKFITRPTVKK